MFSFEAALAALAILLILVPGAKPVAGVLARLSRAIGGQDGDPYQTDVRPPPLTAAIPATGPVDRDAAFAAAEVLTRHFKQHNHAAGLAAAREAGRALFCTREPAEPQE